MPKYTYGFGYVNNWEGQVAGMVLLPFVSAGEVLQEVADGRGQLGSRPFFS
jgi:hypothetical protein